MIDKREGYKENFFYLPNYFIDDISVSIYDSIYIKINDKVVFDIEEHYIEIENVLTKFLKSDIKIHGKTINGSMLLSLIYSMLQGEEDEEISKIFGIDSLQLTDGSDNLTLEAAGLTGIRMWSLDINDIEVSTCYSDEGDMILDVDFDDAEYENINDYFLYEEEYVEKTVVVITNQQSD